MVDPQPTYGRFTGPAPRHRSRIEQMLDEAPELWEERDERDERDD